MKTQNMLRLSLPLALAIAGVLCTPAVLGQDPAPGAKTVADPLIPVDELTLLLEPLTQDELVIEAEAWLLLLQAKVQQISDAEIRVKHKNVEIAKAEEKAAAAPVEPEGQPATEGEAAQEVVEKKAEEKAAVVDDIVKLREQRSKLVDRMNAVIAALKLKGGETEGYELYVTAVSGIKIDVSDASAAWVAFSGWLKSEEGGIRWVKNIIWFIVTIIGFWILSRIASRAVAKALGMGKKLSDLLRDFLTTGVRRGIMLVGLIVALAQLEVNIGPLMAAIGAAGFVIAFALQGTLSNFASGLLILIYRPFDVGDVVDVAGATGSVQSMSLVSTTIKTFDNKTVVVPNNSIWGDVITNVTGNDTRRVDMVFGIGYDDDGEKARTIIDAILAEHELVLDDPQPVVRMHELADSSVNFICRPWVKTLDYWTVYWDVTKTVKERFDAEGISIPYPQQDVHTHQVQPAT